MNIRHEIHFDRASRHAQYCEGYFATQGPRHLLGVSFTTGVTENGLASPGSTALDDINAFDLAEVAQANLGQLNIITVSSFCGPHGVIWGYDVCRPAAGIRSLGTTTRRGRTAEVLDGGALRDAFARLVGSVDEKRFPMFPGSHLPAATKSKTVREEGVVYTGLGIGIPEDRNTAACLMMEDTGFIAGSTDAEAHRDRVLECVAQSVLEVGANQRVRYRTVFAGYAGTVVGAGQTGCALVLAPYFLLARDAFPRHRQLTGMTLEEWEESTGSRFLHHKSEGQHGWEDEFAEEFAMQ